LIIDEEERKKRLERARQISNSINARKNTVNNSNMYTNQEYINRFNRAREISNSINPRKNNTIRTVSQEELAKSEENGKFFMDLIDKNVNSDDSEKTNPVQETGISNKPIENKNEVNVNKLTPEQQKELQNKVKEASNLQAPNSKKTEISIINNQKEKKNWFQANELEDGYQFGDISKTILGTGTDIVQDLATGILSPIENVFDIGTNVVATVQNILGFKDAAKKTRNFADKNITQNVTSKVANASTVGMLYNLVNGTPEKVINPAGITYDKDKNIVENYASGLNQFINETGEEQGYENSSVLGTNTDQVVELFGYTLGLSGIGGSLSAKTGTKTIGSSKLGANLSGGNIGLRLGGKTLNLPTLAIAGGMAGGLQEANSKPNVSEVERWTKAFISGGVEGTTEGIFGVLGVGGNEITDEFGKKLVSKFTSKAAKTLANLGVKMTGEAAEEFLSYTGNFFADNRIIDKLGEADFHYDWNWADVFEQMTLAALSAGLGSSTAMIINSNSATKSAEEQLGRELTQEEKKIVTKAVVDDSLNKQIEQMYQNEDIPQKLYVSTFNPDGTIANVEETRGKSINNPNKKVNVQPAIVKTGNDIYTVIDTETGLRLDTTPYNSMLAAEAGFNSKMINLKERDITAINKKVAMSDYSVRDALLNTAYTIQNDIVQRKNTAQTFQNNNTDVQSNETQNMSSQNDNAVKTNSDVSQTNMSITPDIIESNSELKQDVQTMATNFLDDLSNSTPGQRYKTGDTWTGQKRSTTKELVAIKDNTRASWNQISQSLEEISNGNITTPLSRKIVAYIDSALTDGYRNIYGQDVLPSENYVNTKKNLGLYKEAQKDSSYGVIDDEDARVFGEKRNRRITNTNLTSNTIIDEKIRNIVKYNPDGREITDENYIAFMVERYKDNKNISGVITDTKYVKSLKDKTEKEILDSLYDEIKEKNFKINKTLLNENQNKETINIDLEITKQGIKESLNKSMSDEKLSVIPYLDILIKSSNTGIIRNETKNRRNILNWYYIYNTAEINGNLYAIKIDLKKTQVGDRFYVHRVNLIKNEGNILTVPGFEHATESEYISPSINTSISQKNNSVKTNVNNNKSMQNTKNNTRAEKISIANEYNSQGNKLTKAQQEFFKDSKVRDETGNLLVVYHGTNNFGFTEFKRNVNFYTSREDVASTYTGNNGIYRGYLNIKNPIVIDAQKEKWSMIDIDNIKIVGINNVREFLHEQGASVWQEKGKTRTSTADLVQAISEAIDDGQLNADGIIIQNIYDEGIYSNGKAKLGTDYITFKSNQFKNIDNQKPTSNPDIRYEKITKTSNNKTLITQHNTSEEQVKIQKELHNRIQNSILSKNSKGRTYLGAVSEKVANKIKKLFNIETLDRRHVLADNEIRHMLKEHGNPEIEKAKGQIAITTKDIERIPEILNNYDRIVKGTDNKEGNTIRYIKRYSYNTSYVVEVIPSEGNALKIKTMWKKPVRVTNSNNTPSSTSKTKPGLGASTSSNSISQNNPNVKDNGVRAESISTKSKVIYDEETNSLKYNNQPLYFRFDTQDGFKGKEHKSGVSMWEDKVDDYIYDERNEKDLKTIYGIDDILELDDDKLEKLKREIAEDNGWITNGASVFNFTDDGIDFFREYDRTHYVTDYEKVHIFTGTETEYGADLEDVVIPDVIVSEMNTVDFMNIVESTLEQNENKNIETINKKILQNIARNINSNNQTANRYEKPTLYDERKHSNDKNFINNIKDNNYLKTLLSVDNSKGATNAQSSERLIEQEIELVEFMGAFDNNIPVTKLTDIRKTIENYLGKKLLKGHFREPAYGIYKSKNDFIRVKELKDIDNILHEVGHALDLGQRITINKGELQNELLEAVQRHGGYENDTKTVQLEEGWAEVVRVYIINQSLAEKLYPKTASFIDNVRQQDKSINDFLTRVQNQLYNYIHQNPRNRILSNMSIGEQTDKEPMTPEKFKKNVMRLIYDKDYLLKTTVNDWAKMSGKRPSEIDPSRNAYILTRLASGVNNKAVSMISDGYIDVNGDKLMPGLNKLGEILNNDSQRFNDLRAYLVAKRDLEYKAKSLKTGIRTLDSKAVVKQFENDIQIQEAAQIVYDTLNGVLQYAVNNGLITQENADTIKESNTFYIPFQRVVGKNQVGRRGAVSEIIKGRTGSELDIKDVLENIVVNSANIIQQVENNNVLRALYEQGEELGMQNAIFDVIPTPVQHVGTATLSTWESELKKQGVDVENIDLEKTIDIFAPNNKIDQENRITSFIGTNGNRVYLQFTEQDIFNSIMALDKNSNSWFLKLMGKLNMPLRYGATMANIGFAIPNMIADTAQAAIYSEAGFIPVIDNVIGILDILAAQNKTVRNFVNKYAPEYAKKIEYLYNIYQQSGASSSTRLSQYRKSSQEIMKDIYGTKNSETLGIKESFKPLKRLLDIMTYIPELSEQSTRFRVFERNYEAYKNKGGSEIDARTKAAIESRDATQDFGRTGTAMREINQLIPFSAARVGSVYTFSEKVTQNTKKTMTRIALLSVLAMLIKAIGYDDKEIEELNQRKKNDNFVLNIGGTIVTIKKPQGVLRSILSLEEYVLDLATGHIEEGKEGEMLGKWLETALMDNLPADEIGGLVPNAIAPIIENAYNKDFYYNSDIVKSYDLDLPESQQYYDYTSQLAIFLGKIFNYSPAKIDNLISGYFGGLGTQVTNIIDNISGKLGLSVEKPVMGAEDNAIGKRFVVNVNENSASIDEIYTLKNELTKKLNGGTITSEENKQLETLKQATSDMAALNKQIKAIKKDLTMSGTEKADKIRPLQEQKTDVARKALGKDPIYTTRTSDLDSLQFYPSRDVLSKNNYTLSLTEEMKKEYEKLAYSQYQKYKKQGIYSEEYLDKLKSKCKDYAKSKMMQKYKNKLTKSK
jgi:hypothetical protein